MNIQNTFPTMKKILPVLISIMIISCGTQKETGKNDLPDFGQFPLPVPEHNSLLAQWEKKTVQDKHLIDDMETEKGWKVTGIGEMSYTSDRSRDGKRSLRFRTSLRDEEHYRKNRTEWGSLGGTQGGNSSVQLVFATPQDWSGFNRISFWVYVHPADRPTFCLYLYLENEGTVYNSTTPRKDHFIQDLKPGKWNHVLFEIPHIKRDRITEFEINQMLIGHNPDEEGIVTYDIDCLELQKTETDQYEGWNVAPGKISFSHIGYRPRDRKIALAGSGAGNTFQLVDRDNNIVYSGDIDIVETNKGKFNLIDFPGLVKDGFFRIRTGNLESGEFQVNDNIWLKPVYNAINFYFCERCGFNVPGIHTECHKDWQGFRGDDKKIINGGWHDAGDLSQGSWRTAMSVFAMMNNLENLRGNSDATILADRILDEIAWGVEWLLKTRFGDGYHMSFSVMRIYTDNKTGTIDDVVAPAQNVPWENFLAAAVQCRAAGILADSHPELAEISRQAAIEDWQAAFDSKEKWDQADYREASWGAASSLLLAEMTGEQKYIDQAPVFGKLLTACQEQSFQDGIPITGYFYENTNRQRVIHNLHAAFEEAPLIALAMLCRELPDHNDWISWYAAAVLHSEFFMKRGSGISAPFNHLPNSVWKISDIMSEKDTSVRNDMLRQFNDGTHLNDQYVLRTFPIYRDGLFHGNTNIHMSSSWALAEASRLRRDSAGMELVGQQLRWIFGANPFSQSLMYGTGYDFAPHFAYCLKNVVGSLPVGMDCMNGDMPHWCATNTATSKEIWVEPVNRFLGTVSVFTSFNATSSAKKSKTLEIITESGKANAGRVNVKIRITGSGKHNIYIATFNAVSDILNKQIDLASGGETEIIFELKITDLNKPYLAVIKSDNAPESQHEIIGSLF